MACSSGLSSTNFMKVCSTGDTFYPPKLWANLPFALGGAGEGDTGYFSIFPVYLWKHYSLKTVSTLSLLDRQRGKQAWRSVWWIFKWKKWNDLPICQLLTDRPDTLTVGENVFHWTLLNAYTPFSLNLILISYEGKHALHEVRVCANHQLRKGNLLDFSKEWG